MLTESVIDVRYPDCDPMGIVHHAVYPIWYEIARMDFFAAAGFSYTDMNALGINPPMVNLNLNYGAPVYYPGKVTVRTSCTFCQGKKIELRYAVYPEGASIPSATATSFHIWTGPDMKSLDMSTMPETYEKLRAAQTKSAVLIFAGGKSSRMGTDKALAEIGNRTMLQRAVDFWRDVMPDAEIYISAGGKDHLPTLPAGTLPVYDLTPDCGPMGGLQAAFAQTKAENFYISAVDMPLLNKAALDALNQKRSFCEDILVFTKDGRKPEPLFGAYRRTCADTIDRLMEAGDYKMSHLLEAMRTTIVKIPDSSWVANTNTPEELSAAKAALGE